jgi:hypothetical protein
MFGANSIDSSWVFTNKRTNMKSYFKYDTRPYFNKSNKIYLHLWRFKIAPFYILEK